MGLHRPSLSWRIVVANALVLAAAAAALLLTPVTVSHPVAAGEAAVVVAGVCVMLLANLWLVRRALMPLSRLADDMDQLDLLQERPSRAPIRVADAEITRLAASYGRMLERLRLERRDSARRTASAQEAERRHVARELHDQIGQVLTGLVLMLDRVIVDVDPATRERLVPVREGARGALQDVRNIARRLRPDVLDDLGLVPALQALATRFSRQSGVHIDRDLREPRTNLDHDAELAVYRIAQEALTNVARHARARNVYLKLEPSGGGVRLSVCDDGVGVNGVDPLAAGGLRWMRERAILVDGTLSVRPRPGAGTIVSLEVPGERP
jgi:two-component system sensor histidine kinase UhpB